MAGSRPDKNTKMTPADEAVSANLSALMSARGLDDEKLAKLVGCSWQQISKYRRGLNRMSAGRLWELSRIFDVKVDWFFRGLVRGG